MSFVHEFAPKLGIQINIANAFGSSLHRWLGRLRTASQANWRVAVVPGLILLTLVSRLPFLNNLASDEIFYLIVGRQWLEGLPPYIGTFDVKPPLLFGLMAASETLFGPTLLAAKAVTMLAVSVTASGLYVLGRRHVGTLAGLSAAVSYVIASLSLGGTLSPAELLMAPFTTFGMLAALPAVVTPKSQGIERSLLLAGICFGAAACVKHTAIFEAAPLAMFVLFGRSLRQGVRAVGVFAAGGCLVPGLFALYFFAHGHLGDLIADVVVSAFGRASATYVPWSEVLNRFCIELFFISPLCLIAAAAWLTKPLVQARKLRFIRLFFTCWAAGAMAGLVLTRAMLFFYMVPVLQGACLLAGLFVQEGLGQLPSARRRFMARFAALATPMLWVALSVTDVALPSGDNYKAGLEAAAAMRNLGLTKQDRVLVADRDSVVYLTSGANPPMRIFNEMHLLCNFSVAGASTALDEGVKAHPAFIVRTDPPTRIGCEQPHRRDLIEATLKAEYCPVGRFGSTSTGGDPAAFLLFESKAKRNGRC